MHSNFAYFNPIFLKLVLLFPIMPGVHLYLSTSRPTNRATGEPNIRRCGLHVAVTNI